MTFHRAPRRRLTMGLATLLIVCFSALVITSLGIVLALNANSGRELASTLIARIVERDLKTVEDAVVGHVKRGQERARGISGQVSAELARGTSSQDLVRLLRGMLASDSNVARITVHDALRPAIVVERSANDENDAVGRSFFQTEPTAARGELGNASGTDVSLSMPYFDKGTGQTVVNYRVPLGKEPIEQSWIDVEAYLTPVSRIISFDRMEEPSTGFALLDGVRVAAHPTLRRGVGTAERPLPTIDDLGDPVLKALPTAGQIHGFETSSLKDTKLLRVETPADTYLLAVRDPPMDIGGHTLTIGVYSRANEIREPLSHFFRSTAISMVVLAFALVVAWVIARLVARPINQVSHSASEIEHIAFNSLDRLPRSRVSEIDQLARAFNAMIDSLRLFGRYVPRRLVERLLLQGGGQVVEERIMTVMFTDIVGYTRLCEGLSPREVAGFINDHMTMLGECVEAEGGTIDKYIGDALMAFWGAPEPITDHTEAACRAAERIAEAIRLDNIARAARGLAPVRLRIGIHTGPLIVGDIGSPSRVNYTVIGDTVNVAARLEDLGREIDSDAEVTALVSGAVAARLSEGWRVEAVGRHHVRGRESEIDVYRLRGRVRAPVEDAIG